MARGLACLLGYELPVNFLEPYLSRSPAEFWRRWHVTLSTWLRDYLYVPLGGNRRGRVRTYLNLLATMLLGGLWRGAGWNFLVWGGSTAYCWSCIEPSRAAPPHKRLRSRGATHPR